MIDDERDDLEPDEPDDEDEEDELDDDDDDASEPLVTIEIVGLSLYTHHGVDEAERKVGQRLVFDLSFDVSDSDATVTDRLEDTIDYAEVCQQVALAAQERSYKTLERLCAAIADRMMDRYNADAVTVRATKPEPPIPLPVVEGLAGTARISIDTMKLRVAEAALDAGASYVNDVTAFRHEPELAALVADRGADCCLMHMLGEPRTMQRDPRYADVVADVKAFLAERLAYAVAAGVAEERIQLDPGIGFGKTLEHNLELLRRLDELTELGRPLVIGTSRKSFLGRLTGRDVTERVPGTIATCVLALERGASVFRVHDVAEVADALKVAAATLATSWPATSPTTTTKTRT